MKKLQVQSSDETRSELLKIQLERKVEKVPRTTIVEVASDVQEKCLKKILVNSWLEDLRV